MLPGLNIEEKAAVIEDGFWHHVGGQDQFEETRLTLRRGADGPGENFALLTVAARDADEKKVGRKFWNAAIEMALGNYPGFQTVHSSRAAQAVTIYWPTLVSADKIDERGRDRRRGDSGSAEFHSAGGGRGRHSRNRGARGARFNRYPTADP